MKLKEMQKILKEKKLGGILLFYKDPNFFYFLQETIDNALLLIPSKGKPILLKSPLEEPKTKFKTITYKNPYQDLQALLEKKKIKKLGINESSISVKQHKKLSDFVSTTNMDDELLKLRETKTSEEVKKIKKACKLTDDLLKQIVKNFDFEREGDISIFIKKYALENNCELAFDSVVASGKNASVPHHNGNSKLKKGFLILDLGMKYKGYCADITRTFYVGTPSEKERELYEELLDIQKKAIEMVKPRVKVKELEGFVRGKLGDKEKYFNHSLGHGLGIQVHEAPGVGVKSEAVLEKGMVITIEPGVYKNYGIRIEDDVLVTEKGCRVLSRYPKELIIPKV